MELDRERSLELGNLYGKRILDIGAGDLALIAADRFNCRVTSIDVSESALENERGRVEREGYTAMIDLKKLDASDLPFGDDHFDAVISYGALHHNPVEKRDEFIEEVVRVAKDKVIIMEFKEKHHIHPEDVHPSVDHAWLERRLESIGELVIYEGKEKFLYILEKQYQ